MSRALGLYPQDAFSGRKKKQRPSTRRRPSPWRKWLRTPRIVLIILPKPDKRRKRCVPTQQIFRKEMKNTFEMGTNEALRIMLTTSNYCTIPIPPKSRALMITQEKGRKQKILKILKKPSKMSKVSPRWHSKSGTPNSVCLKFAFMYFTAFRSVLQKTLRMACFRKECDTKRLGQQLLLVIDFFCHGVSAKVTWLSARNRLYEGKNPNGS